MTHQLEAALPLDFLKRMQVLLKDEYEDYLKAMEQDPYRAVRINLLRHDNTPLSSFSMRPSGFAENSWLLEEKTPLGGTVEYLSGLIYPQEPSASLPVTALGIEKGMRILDLCAAPGSKSTQIAELLNHTGVLVCNEISAKRAEILKENIERQGIVNAVVLNSSPERIAETFSGWFDAVLVDAPCSGEGMFRKEADAVSMWSRENVLLCARRQKEILACAARCVRSGGTLVYSTCTFSEEENEQNVNWFLNTFEDFELVPVHGKGHDGTEEIIHRDYVRRVYPMDGGEGQFAARFLRKADAPDASELSALKGDPVPKEVRTFLETYVSKPFPYLYVRNGMVFGGTFPFIDCGKNRMIRHQTLLGKLKSGRFEPGHALVMNAYAGFQRYTELTMEELSAYRHGEALRHPSEKGWTAVGTGGHIIGLAKSDGMILKNHYPKSFRKR